MVLNLFYTSGLSRTCKLLNGADILLAMQWYQVNLGLSFGDGDANADRLPFLAY